MQCYARTDGLQNPQKMKPDRTLLPFVRLKRGYEVIVRGRVLGRKSRAVRQRNHNALDVSPASDVLRPAIASASAHAQ